VYWGPGSDNLAFVLKQFNNAGQHLVKIACKPYYSYYTYWDEPQTRYDVEAAEDVLAEVFR
jgi:hypothetical protein